MKVIFLQNTENNKVGDIKEVADGYARNYLLRNELALPATKKEIENVEGRLTKLKKEEEVKTQELEKKSQEIEKVSLKIKVEAGPEDEDGKRKLFGSVTPADISEAFLGHKLEINKKDIVIEDQVKELGDYKIMVKLGHGVTAKVELEVTAEQ